MTDTLQQQLATQPSGTHVLVTGGAGYVGSVLVPKLLAADYHVTVLDLLLYGSQPLDAVRNHANLCLIKGDIRNQTTVEQAMHGVDTVIHLACISNDPSFELDPALGRSINYEAFPPLVRIARNAGVGRFIYASSSSVYGIKDADNVTEELALQPLTDYSKSKAMCEEILLREQAPDFTTVVLRPATVCGYSPRQRLDLTVNILTNHAVNTGTIKVFGGNQRRPNIHIEDMANAYLHVLREPSHRIAGEVFNVGHENHGVASIAEMVRHVVGEKSVTVETVPTDDHRSYHISSEKIRCALGFTTGHTVTDAIGDLVAAFRMGWLPDALNDPRYYNIKVMQVARLS